MRQPFPFILRKSVLLVIDMQKYFLDRKSHAYLPLAQPIIARIRKLINLYRVQELPIIFTQHAVKKNEDQGIMGRWWRDTIREGTPDAQIIGQLKPRTNEFVLRKTRYSAFCGTNLEQALKRHKIKRVVITGVMTNLCCETTARDAFMRDFEVFFVRDATAAENQDLHLSSLKTLAYGFAVLITTKKILCAIP